MAVQFRPWHGLYPPPLMALPLKNIFLRLPYVDNVGHQMQKGGSAGQNKIG